MNLIAVSFGLLRDTLKWQEYFVWWFEEEDTLFQYHVGKRKGKGLDIEEGSD